MANTSERLKKSLKNQGLRFANAHIPEDVYQIIKDRQRQREMEIKRQFSMESTVYMIIRESTKR